MARKTKADADKTRKRILASALSLFAKRGYENTTFTDIAARLKMTKGAVYWHFASKEALLLALVDQALERFRNEFDAHMVGDNTFLSMSEMMIHAADGIINDARGVAFFRLMKCQIRWNDSSTNSFREAMLARSTFDPKIAFKRAIAGDIAAGRIRRDVNAEQVSTTMLALWDGLVQLRLDHFLECDLVTTLRHAYDAVWRSIKV